MKLLAELACARAPSTTTVIPVEKAELPPPVVEKKTPPKTVKQPSSPTKSNKNHVKDLFDRKKDHCNNRQIVPKRAAKQPSNNSLKLKKPKKPKDEPKFPLIRTNQQKSGMPERKKRRESTDKKKDQQLQLHQSQIKDVYDFDDEDNQNDAAPFLPALSHFRSAHDIKSEDQQMETDVEKSKVLEISQEEPKDAASVTGPMDDFVERKKRTKGVAKKKNKKKNHRNAWYENDSSDEFVSAVKTDDVGVGVTKSQRTCSKGKQNLFAELSSSSDSELEDQHLDLQPPIPKKSESSELSDHPLVIDEERELEEQRTSDNEIKALELDDLYREDSSVVDSDRESVCPPTPKVTLPTPSPQLPLIIRDSPSTKTEEIKVIIILNNLNKRK